MKIFSAAQIREWDAFTIEQEPISSEALMERAATACFKWIQSRYPSAAVFAVFCGTGNNGGDGLALARMLGLAGHHMEVYILEGERRSPDFIANYDKYPAAFSSPVMLAKNNFPSLATETIIVDALFGTGLNRALTGNTAELVERINQTGKVVISIDIPSGLFADQTSLANPVIRATHTLTFQVYKLALLMAENAAAIGEVHLLDIGLHQQYYAGTQASLATVDANELRTVYKPRQKFTHKYNFGHAYLVAGSRAMMGAAILCAKACLRSGAGLVTVRTTPGTEGILQTALPEAITHAGEDWREAVVKKNVIGFGPGLENSGANEHLLKELLTGYTGGLVIDATGLQLLSGNLNLLKERGDQATILTPHTGEFEKLFGKTANDFERIDLCMTMAQQLNCCMVLKGHHSFIAVPGGTGYFNTTGNAGMATAGSGDVLTGILTALLAQGYTGSEAALLGVYLHGLA